MNLLLKLFGLYRPGFVRNRALRELFEATARAFGCEVPPLGGLPFAERLQAYALFTAEKAEEAIRQQDDLTAIEDRLYRHAYGLGRKLKEPLRLADTSDVMAAARVLYGIIGIDFEGDAEGEIIIRRCYFSRLYSPEVCRLISALDEGVLAGLAGGGRLVFTQRITEGNACCRACWTAGGT
jgi:hypothetical protein